MKPQLILLCEFPFFIFFLSIWFASEYSIFKKVRKEICYKFYTYIYIDEDVLSIHWKHIVGWMLNFYITRIPMPGYGTVCLTWWSRSILPLWAGHGDRHSVKMYIVSGSTSNSWPSPDNWLTWWTGDISAQILGRNKTALSWLSVIPQLESFWKS